MMHRLRRYDVFRFAQNDVAPVGRNDAMFALCAIRHTSLGIAVIIGVANIICLKCDKKYLNRDKNEQKVSKLLDALFLFIQPEICFFKPLYNKVT